MNKEKAKAAFENNVNALADGNPCKPDGGLETNLAAFWFDVGAEWAWGEVKSKTFIPSDEWYDLKDQLEKLQAERQKLRECVEFYADVNNWYDDCGDCLFDNIKCDMSNQDQYDGIGGKRARQCLKEIKGSE